MAKKIMVKPDGAEIPVDLLSLIDRQTQEPTKKRRLRIKRCLPHVKKTDMQWLQLERGGREYEWLRKLMSAERDKVIKKGTVNSEYPFVSQTGKIVCHEENTLYAFNKVGIECRRNLMTHEDEINVPGRVFCDEVKNTQILSHCRSLLNGFGVPSTALLEQTTSLCARNNYHPVKDWIEKQVWDGKSRLKNLMDTIVLRNPGDKQMAFTFLKKWLIQCVAALYVPNGLCAQGMLVFVSSQGLGKTTWIKSLVPDESWVGSDKAPNPQNKDDVIDYISYWLVEFGEIDGIFKKSDAAAMKPFLSRNKDKFRAPFMAKQEEYKRRTASFGSVNEKQFLVDTQNRRYWPLDCESIDAFHKINIGQLWAEIKVLYDSGEAFHFDIKELEDLHVYNKQFKQEESAVEKCLNCGLVNPRKDQGNNVAMKMNISGLLDHISMNNYNKKDKSAVANYLRDNHYKFCSKSNTWLVAFSNLNGSPTYSTLEDGVEVEKRLELEENEDTDGDDLINVNYKGKKVKERFVSDDNEEKARKKVVEFRKKNDRKLF